MARATASTRFHTSVDGGSKSRVPLTALIKVAWEIPCYHVASEGTDKTAMDFRRLLPEIRWQSCLSPDPALHLTGHHVHQFLHRRGALMQLRRLVFGEFDLVDLLDPGRAQFHRNAHEQPVDAVLAFQIRRPG